jgi:hypothetical protein
MTAEKISLPAKADIEFFSAVLAASSPYKTPRKAFYYLYKRREK